LGDRRFKKGHAAPVEIFGSFALFHQFRFAGCELSFNLVEVQLRRLDLRE
jgi:hypothetical protein